MPCAGPGVYGFTAPRAGPGQVMPFCVAAHKHKSGSVVRDFVKVYLNQPEVWTDVSPPCACVIGVLLNRTDRGWTRAIATNNIAFKVL